MQVHECESVHMCRRACAHSSASKVQFLQVPLFYQSKIGLLFKSHKSEQEKITDPKNTLLYFVSTESHHIKITPHQCS